MNVYDIFVYFHGVLSQFIYHSQQLYFVYDSVSQLFFELQEDLGAWIDLGHMARGGNLVNFDLMEKKKKSTHTHTQRLHAA